MEVANELEGRLSPGDRCLRPEQLYEVFVGEHRRAEHAVAERSVADDADSSLTAPPDQFGIPDVDQRELLLEGIDMSNGQAPLDLLLVEVREADEPSFTLVDEVDHRPPGLLDRHVVAPLGPPVQLIEVDPVGLQARQARVAG